ncbi:MAG: universal stress protein [Candidatus Eremiobacteraeota bacterium]|nr:universal stress protein [Candidatus Eremiobacteraeota bacterium]
MFLAREVKTIEAISAVVFRQILVAVDDSDPSRQALAVGLSLARRYEGNLILCHVVSSVNVFTRAETNDYDTSGGGLLASAAEQAKVAQVECTVRLLHGEPIEQLLQVAGDTQADLIVIGTHGRKGLARVYVGSVAEGILRRSSVPVLVVRAPSAQGAYEEPSA